MQFELKKKSGEWQVSPTEGFLVGQIVAMVEGAQLDNATLLPDGTIIGTMKSLWGAVVREKAFDRPEVIRGLGINRAFNNDAHTRLEYRPDAGFYDGQVLVQAARRVVVFGGSVRCNQPVKLS